MSIDFFANKGLPMQLLPSLLSVPQSELPLAGCEQPLYVSFRAQRGISVPPPATSYLAAALLFRDHSQYTGTPSSTITMPHPAVCVSYNNSTPMIPVAATIYKSGSTGYPTAL